MTEDAEKDEATQAAREARLEARREARAAIPGIYIDTWSVTTWQGHLRVTMGEIIGKLNASYRMAAVMTIEDAEELAEELLSAAKRRRERDAKAAEETAEEGGET